MNNRIVEISIMDIIRTLWKRKWVIIIVAIMMAALSFTYNKIFVPKTYTSTTRLYVVNNAGGNVISNQELQAGSALTKDYREIILSEDVLDQTMSNLNLTMSQKEFTSRIKVFIPADTRIISVSVTDTNPEEAARIANELRKVAAAKIKQITQVSDVTTLQEGRVPTTPSGPNTIRSVGISVVVGVFIIMVVFISLEILDDRVKRFEDLEKIDMPLLGTIPLVKDKR